MPRIVSVSHISSLLQCERKYLLSNLLRVTPDKHSTHNIEAEVRRRQGEKAHFLIQRFLVRLTAGAARTEDLPQWLEYHLAGYPQPEVVARIVQQTCHWLEKKLQSPHVKIYSEYALNANLDFYTIISGRFDAFIVEQKRKKMRSTIVDFKLGNPYTYITQSSTARLYCFLLTRYLAERGAAVEETAWWKDHEIALKVMSLTHRYRNGRVMSATLRYGREQYISDQVLIGEAMMRVRAKSADNPAEYPQTDNTSFCLHCGYRAYCYPMTFTGLTAADERDPALSQQALILGGKAPAERVATDMHMVRTDEQALSDPRNWAETEPRTTQGEDELGEGELPTKMTKRLTRLWGIDVD